MAQYSRGNNLNIQGINANVADEKLEEKLIDIFICLGIEVEGANRGSCHKFGYKNPKNAIVKFVNHKFCYQALNKKLKLYKIYNKR